MTADPRPEHVHRRQLPAGADDENHALFVPRPLRSYYLTVTAPPAAAPAAILDAACDWAQADIRHRGRIPGHGDPRPPTPPPHH